MEKRIDEARRSFETSVRFDPQNGFAHYRLGLIYWGTRKTDEALLALARAVALEGPDGMKARPELNRLYVSLHGNTQGLRTLIFQAKQEFESN